MPSRRRCYRPGAAEPCPAGEVVAFDFDARPSLDGLSHNGVCACGAGACARREVIVDIHIFKIYLTVIGLGIGFQTGSPGFNTKHEFSLHFLLL